MVKQCHCFYIPHKEEYKIVYHKYDRTLESQALKLNEHQAIAGLVTFQECTFLKVKVCQFKEIWVWGWDSKNKLLETRCVVLQLQIQNEKPLQHTSAKSDVMKQFWWEMSAHCTSGVTWNSFHVNIPEFYGLDHIVYSITLWASNWEFPLGDAATLPV